MVNVLAVIPVRSGSKRLKNKNMRLINGRPMFMYTVDAVRKSKTITDWVVSTNSMKAINYLKKNNLNNFIKRPESLSGDKVRNGHVLCHSLMLMEKYNSVKYDYIVLLQPTSPIRKSSDIDQSVKKILRSKTNTLASVKGPLNKLHPVVKTIKNNKLINIISKSRLNDKIFMYNASIYCVKRDYLIKNKSFTSNNETFFRMDKIHSIDVDDYEDFKLAKKILESEYEKK